MPIDLRKGPIDPQCQLYQDMLRNLQGNILQAHRREHAVHLFLHFTADPTTVRRWMRTFAEHYVSWAEPQTRETQRRIPGQHLFGNVFLAAAGYEALGYTAHEIQEAFPVTAEDRAKSLFPLHFSAGMAAAAGILCDPEPAAWDKTYRDRQIHAMLLLADTDEEFLSSQTRRIQEEVAPIAEVLGVERGYRLRNAHEEAIEPFGYVDGKSQPLFLQRGTTEDTQANTTSLWDPFASLDLVLLPDPFAPAGTDAFGSYLVFRKLEQNVRQFHQRIRELAQHLSCPVELAEALVMGRSKKGTPVVVAATDMAGQGSNNFDYRSDPEGSKCPFHAHIRRINPRGTTAVNRATLEDDIDERQRRIVRRGMPYGIAPGAILPDVLPPEQQPEHGVGLLFMCFQRSLSTQFGFLQTVWANSDVAGDGSQRVIGLDPIIGQAPAGHPIPGQSWWPRQWGQQQFTQFDVQGCVTMKGGEFFFAPSRPFFQGLEG